LQASFDNLQWMRVSKPPNGLQALQIYAGPRARSVLSQRGLQAADVRVIPAAAGGAKGLVLLPLDRWLFADWLRDSKQVLHMIGSSVGAWRMAVACLPDCEQALAQLGEDYITQTYPREPGKMPTASTVSRVFGQVLQERLGVRADEVLSHPLRRLHVITSRGRGLLHKPGRARQALGWLGAAAANTLSRRSLGACMERVVFSDPRDPLPFGLNDYSPTQVRTLQPANLSSALLASCSVPLALEPVHDIAGGPMGSYWDGGITDYHLHLNYAQMDAGLVLYPHFGPQVVPGWLDKPWNRRHAATPALDNLVLLCPHPDWVRQLPNAKLPDRGDFKRYGEDVAGRQRDWRLVLAKSQQLADEFAELVTAGRPVDALPLL